MKPTSEAILVNAGQFEDHHEVITASKHVIDAELRDNYAGHLVPGGIKVRR